MKISRDARNKYEFAEFKFSEKGNIEFNGNIHLVRMFVQKLNQKRDLDVRSKIKSKKRFN